MSGNASLANPLDVGTLNLSGNAGLTQIGGGGRRHRRYLRHRQPLLAGNLSVDINDPSGSLHHGRAGPIQDAINAWDAILARTA